MSRMMSEDAPTDSCRLDEVQGGLLPWHRTAKEGKDLPQEPEELEGMAIFKMMQEKRRAKAKEPEELEGMAIDGKE